MYGNFWTGGFPLVYLFGLVSHNAPSPEMSQWHLKKIGILKSEDHRIQHPTFSILQVSKVSFLESVSQINQVSRWSLTSCSELQKENGCEQTMSSMFLEIHVYFGVLMSTCPMCCFSPTLRLACRQINITYKQSNRMAMPRVY